MKEDSALFLYLCSQKTDERVRGFLQKTWLAYFLYKYQRSLIRHHNRFKDVTDEFKGPHTYAEVLHSEEVLLLFCTTNQASTCGA